MIEGVREAAIAAGLIDADRFDQGIRDLYRTAADDGRFCTRSSRARGASPGSGPGSG